MNKASVPATNKSIGHKLGGVASFVAFVACIPASNFLIQNVGTVCIPEGPCLLPVAPGLLAPSGVVMIGIALVLRDVVQGFGGSPLTLAAITIGGVLSALFAPVSLAVASAAAFVSSELADFAVFTPLRRRNLATAIVLSGLVGATVDSVIFLSVAFGNLEFLGGQVIGKLWALVVAVPVICLVRSWRMRASTEIA